MARFAEDGDLWSTDHIERRVPVENMGSCDLCRHGEEFLTIVDDRGQKLCLCADCIVRAYDLARNVRYFSEGRR